MGFACGDMRDHIVSYQNDHRPSYWRRRALRQQARPRIDFTEILRVVRFSTFATISAISGRSTPISTAAIVTKCAVEARNEGFHSDPAGLPDALINLAIKDAIAREESSCTKCFP